MNIIVIGSGYVGLVTGACFAELGNQVVCVDVNKQKIENLKAGILPIYEPGLEAVVKSNMDEKRLHFCTSLSEAGIEPQLIFIAVGTPSDDDGSANMEYVLSAASDIGKFISTYCVVVDKSTVPVGVADQVESTIAAELAARLCKVEFDVVSNPEFLREGAAIQDFMQPDRIIIGNASKRSKALMLELYTPIMRTQEKIFFMSVKDAEMTKYVANAMLATKISFVNEMAVVCDKLGVDVENVRLGIGSDARIGFQFINPGCGYGGSCFPKDVKALIHTAEKLGVDPIILRAVEDRNALQKKFLSQKIMQRFGENLSGLTFAIWGLSFKPGTDDMREASSLVLIEDLIQRGASIKVYDPVAMDVARSHFPAHWLEGNRLTLAEHQYDAVKGVNALVLVTEWKSFCYPDIAAMTQLMKERVIFDGRNQYDPSQLHDAGFEYVGIGRGSDNITNL